MLTPSSEGWTSCEVDKRFVSRMDPLEQEVLHIGNEPNKLMALHGRCPMHAHISTLKEIKLKLHNLTALYLLYHKIAVKQEIVRPHK